MNSKILNNIPYEIDIRQLMKSARIEEGTPATDELRKCVEKAQAVAKPRAIYRPSNVVVANDTSVQVGGVTFTSRVMRVNLGDLRAGEQVFPFVITTGTELEAWTGNTEDPAEKLLAESVNAAILESAKKNFTRHIAETYKIEKTGSMKPGSLPDWPLEQQPELFRLLGDVSTAIGVELLESFFMTPRMTVSGIIFPSAEGFESCLLCPQENCPAREAICDHGLYERKYRQ